MNDLLSEKEQIEQLRSWWSTYGVYIIAGIVVAVMGLVGLNYYRTNKVNDELAASTLFESVAQAVAAGDVAKAEKSSKDLTTNYTKSPYAVQAELALARLYMEKNRDQDAANLLEKVVKEPGFDDFRNLARVRLARILLYQNKPQQVVDLLANVDNKAFAPRFEEAKGDAYLALGDTKNAESQYQQALTTEGSASGTNNSLLQLKLLDLPKSAEPTKLPTELPTKPDSSANSSPDTSPDAAQVDPDSDKKAAQ